MEMNELKRSLNASINMLKGFCLNGKLCKGWTKVNDGVMEFLYSDNSCRVRVRLDEIDSIGRFKIFDEREGYAKNYANVVLKK